MFRQNHIKQLPFHPLRVLRSIRLNSTKKKKSRKEIMDDEDRFSYSSIYRIQQEFGILNEGVKRVVDLGFAPGNWLQYAQNELLRVHKIDPFKLNTKCTVIGFDLLFCQAPKGTHSIQGNIYSQRAQLEIADYLKKRSFLILEAEKESERSPSSDVNKLEDDISKLTTKLSSLAIENSLSLFDQEMDLHLYQADLILSDLSAVYLQREGYFNNTMSKPFMRSRENAILRQPLSNPHKSHLDLADAAMLLCCDVLAKNGTFVLRLADINPKDPELLLLERRLKKMFSSVERWRMGHLDHLLSVTELFFICLGKKSTTIDKYDLFDVDRISFL